MDSDKVKVSIGITMEIIIEGFGLEIKKRAKVSSVWKQETYTMENGKMAKNMDLDGILSQIKISTKESL